MTIDSRASRLPMVKIDKKYVFEGPDGNETLAELFDGRSQFIVYHFMLGPGWERRLQELFSIWPITLTGRTGTCRIAM